MGFWQAFAMGAAVGTVVLLGLVLVISGGRRRGGGKALLVYRVSSPTTVTFGDVWVMPLLSRVEEVDLSPSRLVVDRRGSEAPHCSDNVRLDVRVSFMVRVSPLPEDILRVGQLLGTQRASDPAILQELFSARFAEAIKAVFQRFDIEELFAQRGDVRAAILEQVGTELHGFILDDLSLDDLEQTSVEALNSQNILDAQGILKVARMIAASEEERMLVERQRELAAAKHRREMGVVRRG